jgi:hypothetical protein
MHGIQPSLVCAAHEKPPIAAFKETRDEDTDENTVIGWEEEQYELSHRAGVGD